VLANSELTELVQNLDSRSSFSALINNFVHTSLTFCLISMKIILIGPFLLYVQVRMVQTAVRLVLNVHVMPVIQGAMDMGPRLYESELQESMNFCVKLFNDTDPKEHDQVASKSGIGKELLDLTGPVVKQEVLERAIRVSGESSRNHLHNKLEDREESEGVDVTRNVLEKINARRVLHSEYTLHGLETEVINGLAVRLERGNLGLGSQGSSIVVA
jgi:hypothetical protein